MKIKKALKAQGGFTLIEMLIVVAIIAILVAVSIPLVNANLEKARNSTDLANIHAAKSAAVLEYMNGANGVTTSPLYFGTSTDDKPVYYTATDGKIVDTKPTTGGYGKSTNKVAESGTDDVPQGKVIKLTVKSDGSIAAINWEAPGA